MERYPSYRTYRELYLRYQRDVEEFRRLAGPFTGQRVLDLCGGEGWLSLKALEWGAREVWLVDAEEAMIPQELSRIPNLRASAGRVHEVLPSLRRYHAPFDRIVCRQAVNYWLNEETAELAAAVLTPGGIFAFNTFNRKPSETPRVLEYELDGHSFVEVSWLVGDTVHHLQVRDDMEPHQTRFAWLSPERLRELLEPYFTVMEDRRGTRSLYRCEKK